jgi:F-type H+-transporting ATPase subunit delta
MLDTQPDLRYLLNHPGVETDEKREVLSKIFGEEISLLTRHFVFLLLDRRRQDLLTFIQREFSRMADEKNQIVETTVTSAVALTDAQARELNKAVGRITGKNVRLIARVDEKLIGGAKVKIGDCVMDGSLASGLERLRLELKRTSA